MKTYIFFILAMFTLGYLLAFVGNHLIHRSSKKYDIGRKYYPILYKFKERLIYPLNSRDRVKSHEKGINGVQVTKIRSGYKVKR